MSTVTSTASRYFTFYRRTAFFLDSVALASSLTPDRALSIASNVQLEVTLSGGGSISATLTINGTDADGAASEALTFTGAGAQVSTTRFKTVSSIDVTGTYTSATIAGSAVSPDGTFNLIRYAVASDRPVSFSWTAAVPTYEAKMPGAHELDVGNLFIDYEEVWTPRVGDIAVDTQTNDEWDIRGVREQYLGFGVRPHHYRLRAKRFDT